MRLLKDNFYTISNNVYISKYLSDNSITHNSNASSLLPNQYNVAYGTNITTFKSDGSKKVGLELILYDVQMLDEIIAEVQARSIDGVKPSLYIQQTNPNNDINNIVTTQSKCERSDFEFLTTKQVYSDYFSSKMCKVFIGLNEGESGTFAIRELVVNHRSCREYMGNSKNITKQKKVFKITKTNGSWVCDTGDSFLILDNAQVTTPFGSQLSIKYDIPFKGTSPILSIVTNEKLSNFNVTYIKNNKDLLTLLITKGDGSGNGNWNTIEDGGQIIITAETNMYW